MKLTPRDPSPEMLEAAFKTLVTKGLSYADVATGVWRAMHDAAPSAEPVADEPVADDLPSREALADECSELRIILSKVTQALGTGAFASSACSLHFLSMIPEEVKKTVDGLRATRPAAAERGEYPPLPETRYVLGREGDGYSPDRLLSEAAYDADQMRAYVDADRAQRAPLTDERLRDVLRQVAEGIEASSIVMTHWPLVARASERAHGIGAKP